MKRQPSLWLKVIKMHVYDGMPMTKLADKFKLDISKLKYKVKVYQLYGEDAFTDAQGKKEYTLVKKNLKLLELF